MSAHRGGGRGGGGGSGGDGRSGYNSGNGGGGCGDGGGGGGGGGRAATPFALPRDAPGAVTTLLSVLHGAHSVGAGVFGFLTTREACTLRLVSQECREAVAAARWHDGATHISGSLAAWRACFPGAVAANVEGRRDLRDADFAHLAGVKVLNMKRCTGVSDAGLAHLGWHPHPGNRAVHSNHRRGAGSPLRNPYSEHGAVHAGHRCGPGAPRDMYACDSAVVAAAQARGLPIRA
jgi:hypothetical protein